MWPVLLLFGVLGGSCEASSNLLVIAKCCPRNERLEANLTKCVLRENSTAPMAFAWRRDEASLSGEPDATVLFAQRPNCSARRTLRLEDPRDAQRLQLLRNGSLLLRSPTALGASQALLFAPRDFCVDEFQEDTGALRRAFLLCPCRRLRCVNKCCSFGQAKLCDGDDCNCGDHAGLWKPVHPDLPPPAADFSYEVLQSNDGICPDGFEPWIQNPWVYPFHFTKRYWKYPTGDLFNDENVCGDTVVMSGDAVPRQGVMRCYRSPPFWQIVELSFALHVPESLLLALAITTVVVVPRRRLSAFSYVHDHAMCCHAASLLACSLTWTFYIGASSTICLHTPIVIYFSLLSASLWLNVVCVNMACGFWKPLGLQHGRFGGARGMFACYSLYAWGTAAAMTTFTASMWYSKDVPAGLIRPTLHETRTCFREEDGEGKMATLAYYYGPVAALLLINGLLFTSTAFRVRQLRRNSTILTNKLSSGKEASLHNRRSVMVYIKLLWLVGVTEVSVDVAAWASNSNEYYFAFGASCIDLLRAAAIFSLCCCKARTMRALRQRLRACWPLRACWRRGGGAPEDVDLPRVGGRGATAGSDASSVTEVTLCSSESAARAE